MYEGRSPFYVYFVKLSCGIKDGDDVPASFFAWRRGIGGDSEFVIRNS